MKLIFKTEKPHTTQLSVYHGNTYLFAVADGKPYVLAHLTKHQIVWEYIPGGWNVRQLKALPAGLQWLSPRGLLRGRKFTVRLDAILSQTMMQRDRFLNPQRWLDHRIVTVTR